MKSRAILIGSMAVWLCAGCSVDRDATAVETADSAEQEPRVKDRVLEVVCDPDSRSTSEELVPLVREVRARDGRSDRVWEVADEADCIAGPRDTETSPAE